MWLITIYYHEAHQDVCELGGSGSLGRAALVALRAVPSARVPPPSARRNTSKICRLSYVLPVSAEEKRADARSYFGTVCFWRGGEGWGSVFLGEKFLFKLRSREIEKSLVGFTRVRIWFVV